MNSLNARRRTCFALRRASESSPVVWASVDGIPFKPAGWKRSMFHYREGFMVFIADGETGLTLAYGTSLPQATAIFKFLWADVPEEQMREEIERDFKITDPGPKPKL